MSIGPRLRDLLWMGAGAAILLLLGVLVLLFGGEPGPDPQLARKVERLELVSRMQLDLVSASEAEKSAVLAITDRESQAFADQARARTAEVEREERELAELLAQGGTQAEKDLLAEFSQHFSEFRRVDSEVLSLAVQNSNLKAYDLTFGPAARALDELSAALSRLAATNADTPDAKKVTSLALGAEIGALRIQTLLPPHIAEPNDQRMGELEALMSQQDEVVRSDLASLAALPNLAGRADLTLAASRYAELRALREQVLALSRANTNVRSLSLSLDQKRKTMLRCHDALSRLRDAIEKAPLEGATYGGRLRVQ